MARERLTSQEIERLLAGRIGSNDPKLGALSRAVSDVRDAYSAKPTADIRAAHLAAMVSALGEASGVEPSRSRRRRFGFAARVGTAAAGLVLVAGGAMAATGTLPDPVQNAVSEAARAVGLHIPEGDEGDTEGTPAGSAQPSNPTAAENKARADEYTTAKKAWTECVAESAPKHEGPGPFDPEEACGPKPQPSPAQQAPGQQEASPTPADHPGVGPPAEGEQPGSSGEHRPPDAGPPEGRGNNR
jgi:hypothetical protein